MLDISELKDLLVISEKEQRTHIFLKTLVIQIVEEVLLKFFDGNYSTACTQSSLAIQAVCRELGMECRLLSVGACFVNSRQQKPLWAGFWDQEHHAVLLTPFAEIIDLTISHFHIHPLQKNIPLDFQLPIVWWSDKDGWPHSFYYTPIAAATYEPQTPKEKQELDSILSESKALFHEYLRKKEPKDIVPRFILENADSYHYGIEQQMPWFRLANDTDKVKPPFPPWFKEKRKF